MKPINLKTIKRISTFWNLMIEEANPTYLLSIPFPSSFVVCSFLIIPSLAFTQGILTTLEQEIADIADVAKPSVVTIIAMKKNSSEENGGGLLGLLDSSPKGTNEIVIDSGLILSSDGMILAKESVIRKAKDINVLLQNGTMYQADVLDIDHQYGAAVLKIQATNLKPARIGAAQKLHLGSWVAIVGHSFGLQNTLSIGIVSAMQKDGGIRISAHVDPGSNGSPVFGTKAEAVGMVAGRVRFKDDNSEQHTFFSQTALVYPLSELLPFIRKTVNNYYKNCGWIGITIRSDLKFSGRLEIIDLDKNGPGQKAGLEIDDIIIRFAGQRIDSATQFISKYVADTRPGGKIEITVLRQKSELTMTVTVSAKEPIALDQLVVYQDTKQNIDISPPSRFRSTVETNLKPAFLNRRINALEREIRSLREQYPKSTQ